MHLASVNREHRLGQRHVEPASGPKAGALRIGIRVGVVQVAGEVARVELGIRSSPVRAQAANGVLDHPRGAGLVADLSAAGDQFDGFSELAQSLPLPPASATRCQMRAGGKGEYNGVL